MRGFQLWINLPAAEKMKPAGYRDIPPEEIPVVTLASGPVKVIAGSFQHADGVQQGAVGGIATDPLMLDVTLLPGARIEIPVATDYTALAYCFEGSADSGERTLTQGRLAEFEPGDRLQFRAQDSGARLLVLAAKPLREPVAHYGPFVMNTVAEVEQALQDYREGRLTG